MQPTTFYPLLLLGIAAGLIGYVTKAELFAPDRLLTPYFNWLSRAVGPEAPLHGRRRRDWLYKPLGACLPCFSGQLGLWAYVFSAPRFYIYSTAQFRYWLPAFHPGHAALVVCCSIFVAVRLNKLPA